jgi:transposase-like protein
MDKQPIPDTMIEAVRQFADPKVAHDFVTQIRFPNGVACPRQGCGSARVAFLEKSMRWYCNECKKQFSVKVGTIFEDSPIPLTKWLPAIWLLASNRNGISSCEVARALKVTQKTAWFMLHRIRLAMQNDSFEKLTGSVEVDETYIGGRTRHKVRGAGSRGCQPSGRKGMGPVGKTPVMGIVQRDGKARAWVIPSVRQKTLLPKIWDNVEHGATVYTDALHSYKHLHREYVHFVINHAYEYVREHVHTNNVEGFWSVLKRTLGGTYIAARPQHLQAYVEEQVFRFNEREEADGPRFAKALKGADGKRLTYNTLTGKER